MKIVTVLALVCSLFLLNDSCLADLAGTPIHSLNENDVVYYRGSNDNLHRTQYGAIWDMGYKIKGDPAVDKYGRIYYRGNNSHLHRLTRKAKGDWRNWDMDIRISSNPVITKKSNVLYFRGHRGTLTRLAWSKAHGWRSWDMGYPMNGTPSVDSNERIYFQGRNKNLHRLQRSRANGWEIQDTGLSMLGDPIYDEWQDRVLYRGPGSLLYWAECDSNEWERFIMDATLTGNPAIDSSGHVFFRGKDGRLNEFFHSYYTGPHYWKHKFWISSNPSIGPDSEVCFRIHDRVHCEVFNNDVQ